MCYSISFVYFTWKIKYGWKKVCTEHFRVSLQTQIFGQKVKYFDEPTTTFCKHYKYGSTLISAFFLVQTLKWVVGPYRHTVCYDITLPVKLNYLSFVHRYQSWTHHGRGHRGPQATLRHLGQLRQRGLSHGEHWKGGLHSGTCSPSTKL